MTFSEYFPFVSPSHNACLHIILSTVCSRPHTRSGQIHPGELVTFASAQLDYFGTN
ncbi:uncharacterized protein CANTADRAFT_24449 [Suhomyces tanzawaensis NRRL Y-17324]|uniref:Uncharacterized protein n=1 Tax=Suhomyces tanzawaensis NRRL Y-17324 TaxID=984487 RepID=A0A1E4SPW8_9ASCO|nr:uncharacterized protein CANTADRAFT_24449 [Suhomyces tanzawaensis NRRL Y-17324]ODV81545.1 hypothetical protein CANTADRAFT_24449 [Suhomyces tanzawaensis NRRL Y-17324]